MMMHDDDDNDDDDDDDDDDDVQKRGSGNKISLCRAVTPATYIMPSHECAQISLPVTAGATMANAMGRCSLTSRHPAKIH